MSRPPVRATLAWIGDFRFAAGTPDISLTLDGDSRAGPSPMQTLAMSLAGCIGIDVVHILTKGRHRVTAISLDVEGERAETEPRRFVRIHLHCRIAGQVSADAVERALTLSREKYCSVWHSLKSDIDLNTTYELTAEGR